MNNTYFIVVFTSFENILENESNECLTGRDEEMLHVLITHVKDYLFEKTAFFDSRRREEERQREREKERKKNADTQTADIQRTFASDQLYTHDNIIDQSDVFPFVLVCVSSHHEITSSPLCSTSAFTSRQFFNSMSI